MIIVWDEPKREANLVKHGIDFVDVTEDFFVSAIVRPAKEGRLAAIGQLNGLVTVIFVTLGTEGLSIISARPASKKERELFP
ncbi:hypothetical protein S2M10_11850 [Sphingomonas sp. S2M10]|uniref:BrnT family toxin n=1 Tax=Sphingomonas sp. S2M10 TaxID=2705010 RepID=UPI001456F152|nr:BrnT family toxin [Sphingomonas sp. S2M10]NLS26204.1 hypothetical protein [Sphingomonas sp. S2M10]